MGDCSCGSVFGRCRRRSFHRNLLPTHCICRDLLRCRVYSHVRSLRVHHRMCRARWLLLATLKDKLYCMIASILGAFCVTQGWVYFAKYPNLIDIVEGHVDDTDVNAERVWTEIASIVAFGLG